MKYKIYIDGVSREQWEQYAKQFADYSIYQTWPYQQVRADNDNQEVSRAVVLDKADEVVTMCHMRIKNIKPLRLRVGYIQWGPLFRKLSGETRCSSDALMALLDNYLGHRVDVLRIVPNICNDVYGRQIGSMLESAGFSFAKKVSPYLTMMLRLEGSDAEIRSRFHRSWRRGLNKAEGNNIYIREGTDKELLEILERIYVSAKRRKGFRGLDPHVFTRAQESLSDVEKMNVIVAFSNGEPLTAHSTSHLGDTAVGILAGSSEKGLELGSSYLIWWHTLLAAKRAGMLKYDLCGIDPVNNPDVYQFKLRMGAEQARYIGAFEISMGAVTKGFWRVAERIYRCVRK